MSHREAATSRSGPSSLLKLRGHEFSKAGGSTEGRSRIEGFDAVGKDIVQEPPGLRFLFRYRVPVAGHERKKPEGDDALLEDVEKEGFGLSIFKHRLYEIDVLIRNPLGFAAGSTPGAGLGLVGLAERAELRGGTLVHGREGSSFVLRGSIPWTT